LGWLRRVNAIKLRALGYVWGGENQVILAQKLIPFLLWK